MLMFFMAQKKIREFKNRKFYMVMAVFAIIPALFLPGKEPLPVMFKIFLRTIIVFGGFTIVSENLNFTKIKNILSPLLGRDSAKALSIAMNIYPSMRRDLCTGWLLLNLNCRKRFAIALFPGMAVNCALKIAEEIALRMKAESDGPGVVIITGGINSGKSSLMSELALKQKNAGKRVGGIIAEGIFSKGIKTGFTIFEPGTGRKYTLASTKAGWGDTAVGKYRFSSTAFEKAKTALLNFEENSTIFFDEAGPLEIEGKGYAECLKEIMSSNASTLYIAVRESCVEQIRENFLGAAAKISIIRT